jgi:putative hydrolase of the HAD superfamily
LEAVVFDLFFTLVHPGAYPGGGDRIGWLASLLGVPEPALEASWAKFEPGLESGRAHAAAPLGPELTWLTSTYLRLTGQQIEPDLLQRVETDWDLTRRQAILHPPQATIDTLCALRSESRKIGVLSNTHAMESRSWDQAPLAGLVDAAVFSHQIGIIKPDAGAYSAILDRLRVSPQQCVYVGDGAGGELAGAKQAKFALVVLAAEAPAKFAPDQLPTLEAQADIVIPTLTNLSAVLPQ